MAVAALTQSIPCPNNDQVAYLTNILEGADCNSAEMCAALFQNQDGTYSWLFPLPANDLPLR